MFTVGEKHTISNTRESLVVHFDGNEWEEIEVPDKGELFSVWGSSADDIWAGGNNGTLFHYNGVQWNVENLPHQGYPDLIVSLGIHEICGYSSSRIFLYSYSSFPYGRLLFHFFSYENGHITLQDSVWGESTNELWISSEGNMYKGTSQGVYLRNNNSWDKIKDNMGISGVHGTDDKNIFAVGQSIDGFQVIHYNGTDWYEFEELRREDVIYRDVFTVDDEVFVTGYTLGTWPSKTIIRRSK